MIVQFVQFETSLSQREVRPVAEERLPQFRAIQTLVQKVVGCRISASMK